MEGAVMERDRLDMLRRWRDGLRVIRARNYGMLRSAREVRDEFMVWREIRREERRRSRSERLALRSTSRRDHGRVTLRMKASQRPYRDIAKGGPRNLWRTFDDARAQAVMASHRERQ